MLLSSFHKGATPHTALPTRPHGTGAVSYASSPWCKNWCYPRLQLRKWGFREVKGTQGLESSSFHRVILPPGLVKGTDMLQECSHPQHGRQRLSPAHQAPAVALSTFQAQVPSPFH